MTPGTMEVGHADPAALSLRAFCLSVTLGTWYQDSGGCWLFPVLCLPDPHGPLPTSLPHRENWVENKGFQSFSHCLLTITNKLNQANIKWNS
jgi:hypothetical protein